MNKDIPFLILPNYQSMQDMFERFVAFNNSTLHVFVCTYALPEVRVFCSKLSCHIQCYGYLFQEDNFNNSKKKKRAEVSGITDEDHKPCLQAKMVAIELVSN